MQIQVRLFALLADRAGVPQVTLELPDGSTVAEAVGRLKLRFPQMPWPAGTMLAVNRSYTTNAQVLSPGDELAIIPPVSGG